MPKELISFNSNIDNILDNEGINIFLSAKEAIYAYNSSFGILKIRKIAKKIIDLLVKFIEYDYQEDIINYINAHFIVNNVNNNLYDNNFYSTLKKIDEDGILLLNIIPETTINIDELKKLYRKAVFINHPDHGGDTEKCKN